jgi:hypothetical protein
VFALLFSVALAVGIDLFSGRIVEPAEVERRLGLLVLGEIRPLR